MSVRKHDSQSQKLTVTPAKAGVQGKHWSAGVLDSRLRGNDGQVDEIHRIVAGRTLTNLWTELPKAAHRAPIDRKLDNPPSPGGNACLPREPFWRYLLGRLSNSMIPSLAAQEGGTNEPDSCLPVYRITRAPPDCWMVQRPGSVLEHAFDDGCGAEDFVRRECADSAAMVVLRIDALYVAARIDRTVPRLFRDRNRDGSLSI